jgi:membrane protein implicated in regulation of membrane protease activity
MLGIPLTDRWAEPVMLAGAAMAVYGLAFVSAEGFAPDGHLPWVAALVFAVGAALVALRPTKVSRQSADPARTTG